MQIIIDTNTNQATVVTTTNGMPVFPTKGLDLNGSKLSTAEKAAVAQAITLITNKAS